MPDAFDRFVADLARLSDGQRTRGKTTEGRDGDWMPEDFLKFCEYYNGAMKGIPDA